MQMDIFIPPLFHDSLLLSGDEFVNLHASFLVRGEIVGLDVCQSEPA